MTKRNAGAMSAIIAKIDEQLPKLLMSVNCITPSPHTPEANQYLVPPEQFAAAVDFCFWHNRSLDWTSAVLAVIRLAGLRK